MRKYRTRERENLTNRRRTLTLRALRKASSCRSALSWAPVYFYAMCQFDDVYTIRMIVCTQSLFLWSLYSSNTTVRYNYVIYSAHNYVLHVEYSAFT